MQIRGEGQNVRGDCFRYLSAAHEMNLGADFFLGAHVSENEGTRPRLSHHQHTQYLMGAQAAALQLHFLLPLARSQSARLCRLRTPTRCPKRHAAPHAPRERQENGAV